MNCIDIFQKLLSASLISSIVLLVSISLNSALLSIVLTACFGFSLFFFEFLEVGTWIIDLRFSFLSKACSQCYNSSLSHALAVCIPQIFICFIFI